MQYFILALTYSADFVIKLPHLKTPFLQIWKWAESVSQICEKSSYQSCYKRDRTVTWLQNGRCVLLLSHRGDLGPLFHFQSFICLDHLDAKFIEETEKHFLLYVKRMANDSISGEVMYLYKYFFYVKLKTSAKTSKNEWACCIVTQCSWQLADLRLLEVPLQAVPPIAHL